MPPVCLGANQFAANELDIVLGAAVGSSCVLPTLDPAATATCLALRAEACELFANEQRNATLEPLVIQSVAAATAALPYSAKQHDVYRLFINEAHLIVRLSSLGPLSATVTAAQAAPLAYLIAVGDECTAPLVLSPGALQNSGGPLMIASNISFDVPCPGEYLLVLSAVLGNNAADLSGPLSDEQRAGARCVHYGITAEPVPYVCPDSICNLAGCHDARDCEQSRSCNACDGDSNRCIVSTPVDVCTRSVPERNPCADAIDGVACIAASTDYVDDDDSNDGELRCKTGVCNAHVCVAASDQSTFHCACQCAGLCVRDADCSDGNPATLDRCFEGVCVSRPYLNFTTTTSSGSGQSCNHFTDLADSAQPIVAACSATHNVVFFDSLDDATHRYVVPAIATSPHTAPLSVNVACNERNSIGCFRIGAPVCLRLVGNQQLVFQCSAPTAPLAVHSRAALAAVSVDECALRALDAAEIAHAAAAMDVFGGYNAAHERTAPLCGADIETSRVALDIETHGPRTDACCRADLGALTHTCTDGARFAHASGHEWLDRAWLALDRAARYSQSGAHGDALREACCAELYYVALADACGRRGDQHQLGDATHVVRRDRAMGAECVLFDDGHVDGDLNDWVAEQRVVEIYDNDARLRAINVHVLPLARGGGYKAAYLLSARGSALPTLDRGATAACSARTRALLHDAYDQTQASALLRTRDGVPAGAFVGVRRHVLGGNGELPLGVRHVDCATIGDTRDETVYCPLAADDTVTLFADLRQALPPAAADDSDLDRLLGGGVAAGDQSTNTQPRTRQRRARFAVSATVVLPRRGSPAGGSDELRFVLANEDCGAAVVLPSNDESVPATPMALTVPASVCGAWRWAAEGHKLVQSAYATDRTCRGGDNGGIEQCTSSSSDGTDVCGAVGGVCAESPRVAGVPYQYAYEHYAVCTQCRTELQCSTEMACFGSRCCSEQVLHWYKYPTIEHLFVPRNPVTGIESKKK